MYKNTHPIIRALLSIVGVVAMITLFVFGLYLFFYLLLIALCIGSVAMVIRYVRMRFFNNDLDQRPSSPPHSTGRVFEHRDDDHDDKRK